MFEHIAYEIESWITHPGHVHLISLGRIPEVRLYARKVQLHGSHFSTKCWYVGPSVAKRRLKKLMNGEIAAWTGGIGAAWSTGTRNSDITDTLAYVISPADLLYRIVRVDGVDLRLREEE